MKYRSTRFSLITLLLLVTAAVAAFGIRSWAKTASTESAAGSEIIEIGTAQQLMDFRDKVNAGSRYLNARLTADIELEGSPSNQWTPIGSTRTNSYLGSFDGEGHKITGLYISSAGADFLGFIGVAGSTDTTGAAPEIKNLTVSATITGDRYLGAIAGYIEGAKISGCSSVVTISGNRLVGGIVGAGYGGTVTDCSASGTVTGSYDAGGIAGYSYSREIAITDCSSFATVKGGLYAGGILGYSMSDSGTITGCLSQSTVSGSNYAGGIIGYSRGTVTNCTAAGTVTVTGDYTYAGGIVGYNDYTSSVENCITSGVVTAQGKYCYAGGIAASNINVSTISNCSASADVTALGGYSYAGGITGYNYNSCSVINCRAEGTVTTEGSSSYAGGIVGYNEKNSSIRNCTAFSTLTADGSPVYAGGIVGSNQGAGTISDCASVGTVSGDLAGGIVGDLISGDVTNCGWLEGTALNAFGRAETAGVTSSDIASFNKKALSLGQVVVTCLPDINTLTLTASETKDYSLKTWPSDKAAFSSFVAFRGLTIVPEKATATRMGNIVSVTALARGNSIITNNITLTPTSFSNFIMDGKKPAQQRSCSLSLDIALTVKIPAESLTVSGNSSIAAGETTQLTAVVSPAGADQSVLWSSGNTAVATVDEAGKVTGVAAGSALITATAADGSGIKGSLEIKVTEAAGGGSSGGSSSGGCSAGTGAMALLSLLPLAMLKGKSGAGSSGR